MYDAGTEINGKWNSIAEGKTLEEEACTRAGNLALDCDEEWSSDCREDEALRELTRDSSHDDRIDPERAEEAEQVENGAWEQEWVKDRAREWDRVPDGWRDR